MNIFSLSKVPQVWCTDTVLNRNKCVVTKSVIKISNDWLLSLFQKRFMDTALLTSPPNSLGPGNAPLGPAPRGLSDPEFSDFDDPLNRR